MSDIDRPSDAHRFDFCPWEYAGRATEEQRKEQLAWQADIAARADAEFGPDTFVSPLATALPDRLRMGERSYVAAHVYLTQDVTMGQHCTLNPYAVARGRITMGDSVRVGAHTSLLGFNHSFAPDRPVHRQPTTSKGIEIGDDVWIGSHVVVVDGVTIGSHAVIGAGAVVTKDVPAWAVMAGNPARQLRDRRDTSRDSTRGSKAGLDARLAAFADRAREQLPVVLDRCWVSDDSPLGGRYLDRPDAGSTVRAWCDAVEIADLLGSTKPARVPAADLAEHLRSLQAADTGLVPEYDQTQPASLDNAGSYHILCVGYALQLLGTAFPHPISAVAGMESDALIKRLDALPWSTRAWSSGSWIDAFGTAAYRNLVDFDTHSPVEPLFGWLLTHADPWHGMWGTPDSSARWMQVVNGFYRLTRGTYAQFGLPLPYPEQAIDTVVAHSADETYFGDGRGNACNVLDVIHPLWLAAKQTNHRRAEGAAWARRKLERAIAGWNDGAGFSFELGTGHGSKRTPGLQGTEMWLAIIWLLADYLGESDALGYRPRGVHRPEPAATLG